MMSRLPIGTTSLGRDTLGPDVRGRYAPGLVNQGISAELIAARWRLSREQLDAFAWRSHQLAATAAPGRSTPSCSRWTCPRRAQVSNRDETIRPRTTLEGLATLKPSFEDPAMAERFPEIAWSVTAGIPRSSPMARRPS